MQIKTTIFSLLLVLLLGCTTTNEPELVNKIAKVENGDNLMIVDCLLPAQVRKLGQLGVFATARRPIKSTASECEIRGGEYVAYDRASYATALKVWLPKAQAGESEAQAYVGEIYEKGLGLIPNYKIAAQWYEKAAKQGNTRAQINLGFLYERGFGVNKNIAEAMSWYEKSSGLSKVNLPYAASIETTSESELSREIQFLKTELKNSRTEAKNLTSQLGTIQTKLIQRQKSIAASNSTLAETQRLLEKATAQANQTEIVKLEGIAFKEKKEIQIQQQNVAKLKLQYQSKVENLKSKLNETEKRANQFSDDLKRQKIEASEAQIKLLDTQANLASTEKKLLDLKQTAQTKTNLLSIDKQNQSKLGGYEGTDNKEKLEKTLVTLKKVEQEKIQQQQLIDQLTEEKTLSKQSIENLKNKINQGLASSAEVKKLEDELNTKTLVADQFKLQVSQKQEKFLKTKQKLQGLEKSYQELLEIQTMEKATAEKKTEIILSQKSQEHEDEVAQFQKNEEKLADQEILISQLELEKKNYAETIKKLQLKVDKENLSDKPKIEIIDPPFVLVRGMPTVTLRSVVKKRDIIGKVNKADQLLSFMVNDEKSEVDEQGLFQASVKLTDTETPVEIVAIDRNGSRTSLDFILSLGKAIKMNQRATEKLPQVKMNQPWKSLDFGQYYALIIGNNKYEKLPILDTPINDAVAVEKVLKEKYGFKTKLLQNANRYQILSELNKLRAKLNEKDNLLIYYAGHGELDKVNMRGHWLPVDADADNTANWISTVAVTDILNSMSVKHVMVVSDSCYSGAMTRSSLARIEAGVDSGKKSEWLKAMLKARSRTVLTSGGLKPVMDGGGGDHSVFANAFIKTLNGNNTLLEGQSLYRKVSAGIIAVAAEYGIEQVPEYAPIRHAGHESGEFFFVPRKI
ncbi:MAG: caspase family protein [Methylococcales bacterium]|nr:caspase family protein [Methylococcales bacterium]